MSSMHRSTHKTTYHRGRALALGGLLTALCGLTAGCGLWPQPRPPGPPGSDGSGASDSELSLRVERLEDALSMLQCGPPLKALMHEARHMCTVVPNSTEQKCDEKRMRIALLNAEREFGERNIGDRLVTLLRHEVVYLSKSLKISQSRAQRLLAFAKESRQPTTRYLLVSGGDDAQAKIDVVREAFKQALAQAEVSRDRPTGLSDDLFEQPWLIRLRTTKITGADKPLTPGEPPDLERAVFLFRTDCQ